MLTWRWALCWRSRVGGCGWRPRCRLYGFELVPLLGEFLAEYPELRVSVETLSVEKVSREGTPDVMIWPGPLEDSGLLMKPLAETSLGAYASPLYLERTARRRFTDRGARRPARA
jgi:DNA-binding transcriptional LysR family regulator